MAFVISESGYNYATITDKNKKVIPCATFVYASRGKGKTVFESEIIHYFYRNGYTIISVNDIKDEFEFAHAMFDPYEDYQTSSIKKYGCPSGRIPTKLYHPFSESIPSDEELPLMNIFTLDIKSIQTVDLNYLLETEENTPTIQILERTRDRLKDYEGIHHLQIYAENETEDMEKDLKTKVRFRSLDPTRGFSKSKMGTARQGTDILDCLEPFLNKDYFFAPHNCPSNLDIVKIVKDQKTYHSFVFKYVSNERRRLLITLHIMLEIIKHKDELTHPVLIVCPEISTLLGRKEGGFKSFLADKFSDDIKTSRNKGKGIAFLTDGQTWKFTSPTILAVMDEIFIGKVSSPNELDDIRNKLSLKTKDFDTLKSLEIGQFAMMVKDEGLDEVSLQKIVGFMPPVPNKEVERKFIELYNDYDYPKKKYEEEINNLIKIKTDIIKDVERMVKEENAGKMKRLRSIEEGKEAKIKAKLEQETNKVIKKQEQQKEFDLSTARIWKRMNEEEHITIRSIATQYNTNKTKVADSIKKIKEIESSQNNPEHPQINL